MLTDERQSSPNMGLKQAKYANNAGFITRFSMSQFYNDLHRLLDQIEVDSVFDAGCGEGEIIEQVLKARYQTVIGADLDEERLALARMFDPRTAIFQGNLQQIPLADNAVDLVICLEVLEHVGDPETALDELYRVTNRYALLSVPNEPFWRIGNMVRGAYWDDWGNTPEHINHWSVWGFRRFVSQRFRVLEVATPMLWSMILAEKV